LRSETSEFLGKHQLHYRNSLRTLILICWLPHCRLTQTALRVSKQKLQITSTRTLPIYPKLPWHCLPKRWRLERPIPMPITIREVADAELFALLCLYAHLHPEDEMLPLGEAMPTWKTLRQDPNQHFLGAYWNGSLAATCTLIVVPNLTHRMRPYALIENVVTHPDYRRRGLGTAVLKHALATAWEGGCYKVILLTGSRNEETLRFYEQAGFQRGVKTGFVARPGG